MEEIILEPARMNKKKTNEHEKFTILVDSREQKPLEFKKSKYVMGTEIATLDAGDYTIKGIESCVRIERKSLPDLFHSVTADNERFQRELSKASQYERFIILVEGSITDVLNKNWPKSYTTLVKGFIVLNILFTLAAKHKVGVVFCNSRNEASTYIRYLFRGICRNEVKKNAKRNL